MEKSRYVYSHWCLCTYTLVTIFIANISSEDTILTVPTLQQWCRPANAALRRLAGDHKLVNLAPKKGQVKDKKGYFPIFRFQYEKLLKQKLVFNFYTESNPLLNYIWKKEYY